MEEGSAASDYNRVLRLFETANELGYDETNIRKNLKKIVETTCDTMSSTMHASAILDGTLLAVQNHAANSNNNIQQSFDTILEDYGPILAGYASTKATQVRLIGCVERNCLNPESPFAPFFGDIIQTLANYFTNSSQAISEWKANRQAQEAEGNLSPRGVVLLRAIEAIPFMIDIDGLGGLGEEDEVARNMGF